MKRTTLLFAAIFIVSIAMGQNEKYFQKMGEALGQFAECTTVEDFQNLANQFGVIAKVETKEWLPLYYEAHCYILMGFTGQVEPAILDGYLDKASASIDKMLDIAPHEAEVYVMKAFYHTGYLVVDPPARAMNTSPLISEALSRALSIEPDNPRAQFLSISNEMGTANFFGSDTAPICKKAKQLLKSWDDYAIKSPIHPNWGKEETGGIVTGCGE
jgi:hypothetical protein